MGQRLRFKKTLYPVGRRPRAAILLVLLVVAFFTSIILETSSVAASTGTVRPDADINRGFALCTGAGCTTSHYTTVDEPTLGAADYVNTGTSGSGGEVESFNMTSVAGTTDSVSQVVVRFQADSALCNGTGVGTCDSLDVQISIDGALQSAQNVVMTTTSTLYTVTFNGTWSGDNDLQVLFTRVLGGGGSSNSKDDDIRIYQVYANVAYTSSAVLEQSAYRFFSNSDSTNVGSPLAAENTAASLTSTGQSVRLRTAVDVDTASLFQNGESFNLQMAGKGTGTCSVPTGGSPANWTNVSSGGTSWSLANSASFPSNRGLGTHVTFNGKIWFMSGYDSATGQKAEVYSSTDGTSWTLETSAPGWAARNYARSVVFDNKIWIFGGYNGTANPTDVWYSSNGVNWTQATANSGWSGRVQFGAVVYNNKMWIMGGSVNGTRVRDVWSSSDGVTWTQATNTAGWAGRNQLMAGVVNGKMAIMGGTNGSAVYRDVWTSTDGINWTQATGSAPWAARGSGELLEYNNKLWMLGGWNLVSTNYNDIWSTSDGANWNQETSNAGWPGRRDHSAAILNDVMYVYAGEDQSGYLNDTWSSKGTPFLWNDNPSVTGGAAFTPNANDPTAGGATFVKQTYEEGGTFTNSVGTIPAGQSGMWDFSLRESGAPAGTTYCFRIVKADGSTLNTYSANPEITTYAPPQPGYDQSAYRFFNNADSANVGTPKAASNTPAVLSSANESFRLRSMLHVSQYNLPQNGQNFKLQFAGKGSGTCSLPNGTPSIYRDVVNTGTTWSNATNTAAWPARYLNNGATVLNNKIWILGGYDGGRRNDVWYTSDGASWSQATAGANWSARDGHVVLTFNNKLWVIGGNNGTIKLNDVWSSSDGITWTQATANAGWAARFLHAGVVFNNKMWIFGGDTGSGRKNDVWSSSDGISWTQETSGAGWAARNGFGASVFKGKMWIMGGYTANATPRVNDVWSSTNGVSWTQETSSASWSARDGLTTVATGSRLLVIAGTDGADKNDVWSSPDGINWNQETTSALWSARTGHATLLFNNKLWLIGGGFKQDVWSSDDSAISWHNNGSVSDKAALTQNVNDPAHSTDTTVTQSYNESNTFTNTVAGVNVGQDGLWDFALVDNASPGGTSYCFRIVKSDGSALNTYSQYAEVSTYSNTNSAPSVPSSLAQVKVTGGAAVNTGGWTNENQLKLSAQATDTDASGTLQLCVEKQPLGTAFTGSGEVCGTGVAYSGTAVTVEATLTGLTENQYHWQARIKDAGGLYSSWVSYGANAETDRDFGVDTSAPSGTVYDGSAVGVDVSFNDGSLTTLSANWTSTTTISGLAGYNYSIGTSAGATNILGWTSAGTSTSATVSTLSLTTSSPYYFNVRITDNAGNNSVVSSNGISVAPTLTFSTSTNSVNFNNLNSSNSYTNTQTLTLTTATNAQNGYKVYGKATDFLKNQSLQILGMFNGGSYSAPAAWGTGTGFGYNSSDTSVGGSNRFNSATCPGGGAAPCFAPYSTTGQGDVVADATSIPAGGPALNDSVTITNKVSVDSASQQAGKYQTTVTYSAYATY